MLATACQLPDQPKVTLTAPLVAHCTQKTSQVKGNESSSTVRNALQHCKGENEDDDDEGSRSTVCPTKELEMKMISRSNTSVIREKFHQVIQSFWHELPSK